MERHRARSGVAPSLPGGIKRYTYSVGCAAVRQATMRLASEISSFAPSSLKIQTRSGSLLSRTIRIQEPLGLDRFPQFASTLFAAL